MIKGIRVVMWLLLALWGGLAQAQSALEQQISIRVKDVPLEAALMNLIQESEVNLSFANDLLPHKLVSAKFKKQAVAVVLDALLRNTGIAYQVVGDQIVLYRSFVVPAIPTEKKYTISGFIEDAETGERLIAASVLDQRTGKGVETNEYGFFSITVPAGNLRLSIYYLGYESMQQEFLLAQNEQIRVALRPSLTLPEVQVYATDSTSGMLKSGVSTNTFNAGDIEQMPALGGEPDLIRTTHLLPGIQTGADGIGGIHVRGGNPEHNLILIDGVPVYNVSHAAGLFSVFNTDAIRSAQLLKGGFPARYGGRLASVLDIHTKEGNMKRFGGQVEAGLLTLRASLEGPIIKDKSSFFVSARQSLLNWYLNPLSENEKAKKNEVGKTSYRFYDINAKINYTFSEKDKVYLSFYRGSDNFYNDGFRSDSIHVLRNYSEDSLHFRFDQWYGETLRWGNTIAAFRWNHLFNNKLFANTTLTYSKLWTDVYYGTADSVVYLNTGKTLVKEFEHGWYLSSIEDLGGRIDFDYLWSPAHTLRFGANVTRRSFNPGALAYDESTEYLRNEDVQGNDPITSNEYVAYAESNLTPGTRWSVNVGLHAALLEVQQTNYISLQPRFSAYWRANQRLGLRATAGRMTQFLHLLSNSNIGLPTDLWVPATSKVPPQNAWQTSVGLDYNWKGWEFDVEAYYKKMTNLLSFSEGAFFLNDWETNSTIGNGTAYGAEFLLRKTSGNTTGWIAYTLSWSDRQFDLINLGRRYPFKYDRRHDFKIVAQHRFNDWISLNANWLVSSGLAYSFPVAEYVYTLPDGTVVPVTNYGAKNQFRMPLYHRLDASAHITFRTQKILHTVNIGVYNAYNRRNPLYYDLRTKFVTEGEELKETKEVVQVWLLPVLPSVSYSIRF
ncbi:MAG: carboxypeptidase-like regulatory domain-containing protein [Saprospiraceae bacterium]